MGYVFDRSVAWLAEDLPTFFLPKQYKHEAFFLGGYTTWGLAAGYIISRLLSVSVWAMIALSGGVAGALLGWIPALLTYWLLKNALLFCFPVWRYTWLPLLLLLIVGVSLVAYSS